MDFPSGDDVVFLSRCGERFRRQSGAVAAPILRSRLRPSHPGVRHDIPEDVDLLQRSAGLGIGEKRAPVTFAR